MKIDIAWLDENKNPSADKSIFKRVVDYTDKSTGIFRTMQTIRKSLAVVSWNEPFREKLGVGVSALGLVGLPFATSEVVDAVSKLRDGEIGLIRRVTKAFNAVAGAISSFGYAIDFIRENPLLRRVASMADLADDVSDLPLAIDNFYKASQLDVLNASDEVKKAVTCSKNYYLFGLIKSISSIALTIFGCIALLTGVPLMPAIAAAASSLALTLAAIGKDGYEDTCKYKLIKFDHPVTI